MFNILYLHYSETGKVIKSVEILLCWGLERCYVAVINVGYQSTVIFSSSLCNYISHIPIFISEKRNAFPFPFMYGLNFILSYRKGYFRRSGAQTAAMFHL